MSDLEDELVIITSKLPSIHQLEDNSNIKLRRTSLDSDNCSNNKCNYECSRRFSFEACNVLNELRANNQFCDAKIKVDDGTEFYIHRAVLSAASRYFFALFTNGMNDTFNKTIHIKEVDSNIMRHIIEWCYTRETTIKLSYVENLLIAADKFQVLGLSDSCCEFLKKNITPENVIGIERFASGFFLKSLKDKANNFIIQNFPLIAEKSKELLEMDFENFLNLLSSDELNVRSEELIFETIVNWINNNPNERRQFISILIKTVRTGFLSKEYFVHRLKSHEYVKDNEECKLFLIESLKYLYELELDSGVLPRCNELIAKPRLPHEILFVYGGWSGGSPTNAIEIYDTRADKWHKVENAETLPRAYHGCITVDNIIYVIGGFDGVEYFNTCKSFEPKTRKWIEIAPMHSKRCYVSVAVHNNIIYALGGLDGDVRLNTAEKYNIDKNQWTYIAPMNHQRSDANATTFDGMIYICGGFNGFDCLDTAEYYNPQTNQWTFITPMKSKRSGLGVISYNNTLFAIGGFDGVARLMSGEKYNQKTKQWTMIKPMYITRSNFAIEILDGYIFAMGGFNGVSTIRLVECYDNEKDEWYSTNDMNITRSALSACRITNLENIKEYIVKEQTNNINNNKINCLVKFNNKIIKNKN